MVSFKEQPTAGSVVWRMISGAVLLLLWIPTSCVSIQTDGSPLLADAGRAQFIVSDSNELSSPAGSYLAGRFAEKQLDLLGAASATVHTGIYCRYTSTVLVFVL